MRAYHLLTLLPGAAAYHFPILPVSRCMQPQLAAASDDDSSTYHGEYYLNNVQGRPIPASNFHPDRRVVLSSISMITAFMTTSANAQDSTEQSTLEKRILANSLAPPSYGMEATDIFYPKTFQGNWKALSKTTNVFAPCGFELFPGGESGYDNTVQKEIKGNDVLEYRARFVGSGDDLTIADREYNAKEIAKAAMGSFSVVDVSEATPNRFSCLLAPPEGSGGSLICVVRFFTLNYNAMFFICWPHNQCSIFSCGFEYTRISLQLHESMRQYHRTNSAAAKLSDK